MGTGGPASVAPARPSTTVFRRIVQAFLTVAGVSLLIKAVAFLKDLVVAYRLGVGDGLDAFLIALLLPSALAILVGRSAGNAALPVLVAVRQGQGEEAARRFTGMVLLLGAGMLAGTVLGLGLICETAVTLLGGGFDATKQALTIELAWILLPSLWFGGMSHLTGVLLNARERFALVAMAPGMVSLTVVVCLLPAVDGDVVRLLAIGTVLGFGLEWLVLLTVSWRLGYLGLPRRVPWAPLRRMLGQFAPLLASHGVVAGVGLVDQTMAAWLPGGSVAVLSFANKLPTLFTSLGSMALGVALLPHFSAMVANGDWPLLRATARRVMLIAVVAVLPGTALLWLFSADLVSLLFQRGEFHAGVVPLVALTQQCFLLQIPFFFVATVFNRLAVACGVGSLLFANSLLSLLLNPLLNLLFMPWLGVAGIALSTSVTIAVGCGFLAWRLGPLLGERMGAH